MNSELLLREHSDLFKERVQKHRRSLGAAPKRVVEYIERNRGAVLASSAADIAEAVGTSDATVIRTVQAIGFSGLGDLKSTLADTVDRISTAADNMRRTMADLGEDAGLAIEAVLKTHRVALSKLQSSATRKRILAAAAALQSRERIVLFGVGPSGFLASYVAFQLQRSGRRTKVLDSTGIMLADQLLDLRRSDALLAIAYDPPYPEIMTVFSESERLGVNTVLITDKQGSALAQFADMVVPVMRGRTEHVALHGATFICLEALILSLAVSSHNATEATLERLSELRQGITGSSHHNTR